MKQCTAFPCFMQQKSVMIYSWETLARVLTGKRMEQLSHVRRPSVPSVRTPAKKLRRDYLAAEPAVAAVAFLPVANLPG